MEIVYNGLYKGVPYFLTFKCNKDYKNGYYKGFIRIKKGHKLYRKNHFEDYELFDELECLGFISYSGFINGGFYIGFDTKNYDSTNKLKYKDICIEECENLIDQILNMK